MAEHGRGGEAVSKGEKVPVTWEVWAFRVVCFAFGVFVVASCAEPEPYHPAESHSDVEKASVDSSTSIVCYRYDSKISCAYSPKVNP